MNLLPVYYLYKQRALRELYFFIRYHLRHTQNDFYFCLDAREYVRAGLFKGAQREQHPERREKRKGREKLKLMLLTKLAFLLCAGFMYSRYSFYVIRNSFCFFLCTAKLEKSVPLSHT